MAETAEIQSTAFGFDLAEFFHVHESFCKVILDAYVLVDLDGRIKKSNQMFSQITGMKSKQILKKEFLSAVLKLEHEFKPLTIEKMLAQKDNPYYFEVTASPQEGDTSRRLNLSLGVSFIKSPSGEISGAFILIRDMTAERALVGKYEERAEASQKDALTGLYNRGFYEQSIQSQINIFQSSKGETEEQKLAVMMLDIDHFKKINDGHGHPAGDYVLVELAKVMMQTYRKTDILARYGGEEFIMILPSTSMHGAAIAAEKLRNTIANHLFQFDGKTIPVTISLGISQFEPGLSQKDFVARADEALYHSKHSGRNRVSIHDGTTIKAITRMP